jgi:SPP1 gp7 family putative phage head morphogenesis protein
MRRQSRLLRASPQAEEAYVRALRSIVASASLRLQHAALGTREDASSTHRGDVERAFEKLRKPLTNAVADAFANMAAAVSKGNAKALSALGIPLRRDIRLSQIMDAALRDNTSLIVDTTGIIAAETVAIMEAPTALGMRVEDLADLIRQRAQVGQSRAELIARDQTLKLNGDVTKERQLNAGIGSYTWSTSQDERVRPEHAALEGNIYEWSDPPDVGHPGEDIQCRCVAIPHIEEFADLT